MAWRSVHIGKPARLSYGDRQLIVDQDGGSVTLALEDIACLVLDTPQVSVTGALLSACADAGIAVIVPDDKHHPSGVLLPFHRHHAQAYVAHVQVGITQPLKKRLWQNLVVAKITNQADALALKKMADANILREMAGHVGSGDPDNVEAKAARLYWSRLFADFIRRDESDIRNALLNYGYAVVRAALARAVVACGLIPAFGLNHASKTNAFNLVDDLIEPFRPLVDILAFDQFITADAVQLSLDDRRAMAAVLTRDCWIGRERMTVLTATESVATSLVQAMETGSAAVLRMPTLTSPKKTGAA